MNSEQGARYIKRRMGNDLKQKTIITWFLEPFLLKERNILVAEQFIQRLATEYGKHPVRTDGSGTGYPQAYKFLRLQHHLHSSFEKSIIIERTI